MTTSVNTNYGALIALQNLNKTNTELESLQNRINTGLKIASAKDNGAVYAIAQDARGKVAGYGVAQDTVDKAISALDVANTAGTEISNLLIELKAKATQASDASITTAQRNAYNADFVQIRDQIIRVIDNAEFNGVNLIKSGGTNVTAFANDSGDVITITAVSFALGGSGSVISLSSSATISTATSASNALSAINSSLTAVNEQLATFGSAAKGMESHREFLVSLSDALEAGIGNLVDADLSKDSAKLSSLQVKQQLGTQALSIANANSTQFLSLFR